MPLAAALMSEDGRILEANAHWQLTVGEAVRLLDLLGPEDAGPVSFFVGSLPRDCLVKQADGGWRWMSVHAALHAPDEAGRPRRLVWLMDVHERHLREQALQQRVRMQADMLNASVDCIKIIGTDGQLLHMNQAGCQALGVPEDDVAGRPWLPLLPPEVGARGEVALQQALRGQVGRFPGASQLPGQPPEYWDNVLTPLLGTDGAVKAVLCVSRNTTAQTVVEERLRLAVRAANEVIRDWELLQGRITWNEAVERCYGYPASHGLGTVDGWLARVHPEDRARVWSFFEELTAGDQDEYALEYRFAKADGHYIEVRDRGCVSRAPSGQVVRIVGSLLDQTERKAIERGFEAVNRSLSSRIAERTDELNRLWDLSPDLLVVLDSRAHIRRANPSAHRILGYSVGDVLGHHIAEFVLPDQVQRLYDAFALIDKQVKTAVVLRHPHREGGSRWVSWVGVTTGDEIFVAGRDVTAEREARAKLKQTEDELRQAQKMEAIGQLTGGIAHDFNNLLSSIGGALQIIRRRAQLDPQFTRYLDMGDASVRRAAALTQRLLAFSRRQTLDPRAVSINRLVQGMAELIGRSVGPAVRVSVQLEPALWATRVDGPQLENALLNLCINARDAMPDGGDLTLVTSNQSLPAEAAAAHKLPPGDYVGLDVIDTGTGMPPSVVQRVFEPFFTTKPLGKGTGLGLSMVYGFVRQSGGQIAVDSTPGRGTRMSLLLPRHLGEADADEPAAPQKVAGGAGETILLVDDDDAVRHLITELLTEAGYRVLPTRDGPGALQLLQGQEPIGLLLTDVGLPGGMNGRQVADTGRELRPALKVLFITGYAETTALGNALAEDRMEVLAKPFEFPVLLAKVREMLDA
ncbi:hybrid sensor histidine kinase/response regulator [Aquincola tertiaricarbonis]|nr:PAS domain-containing protein [Aquincola tertiaricarbonis]